MDITLGDQNVTLSTKTDTKEIAGPPIGNTMYREELIVDVPADELKFFRDNFSHISSVLALALKDLGTNRMEQAKPLLTTAAHLSMASASMMDQRYIVDK